MNNQTSVTQLNDILTENFGLHKNNSITIADFMISMWLARTVNLSQLANYSSRANKLKKEHIYRSYQYLVHNFKVTQEQLAIGILKMFGLLAPEHKVLLTLDRTNWKYGDKDINLLVLSVVINGCGIPLFWTELDSRGNSDTAERKEVLNKFVSTFGASKVHYILADREFIGNDWFDYLDEEHKIKFVIRIKGNMLIEHKDEVTSAAGLCNTATKINILTFEGKMDNRSLRLQATRSTEGKLVIVASNDLREIDLLKIYLKRWAIECLFGNLKTKGFNFEDTHFTNKARIGNLTKLLVLVHAIALLLGIIKAKIIPIVLKIHGRKQHSYFRSGLDLIISSLMQSFTEAVNLIIACFATYVNWSEIVQTLQQKLTQLNCK
jgi:hypothetical protein